MSDPIVTPRTERVLDGTAIAPGVASGRPCLLELRSMTPRTALPREQFGRIERALEGVRARLSQLVATATRRGDPQGAEIFAAHALILADPEVLEALQYAANEPGENAAGAISRVFDGYVTTFKAIADDYLRARASDFVELRNLLLDVLGERRIQRSCRDAAECTVQHCTLGHDHILLTDQLDLHIAANVDHATRGMLVTRGSARSHGAFIARGLGLPVVAGIADSIDACAMAETIIVDGDCGRVVLDPTPVTLAAYEARRRVSPCGVRASMPVPGFTVMADLDRARHLDDVAASGAEGIGLYRTEFEILAHGTLLDEASQTRLYTDVVERALGAPTSIRLFDLGYDKRVSGVGVADERNPALGLRGARLLLVHPEILRAQARAIARASLSGPIDVIYPMIVDDKQFCQLRTTFEHAIAGQNRGELRHGVMFEVPAACLQSDALFAAADFACIGTSDLTQYLFAIDRDHPGEAFDAALDGEVFWRLLERLVRSAQRARKRLSACGVVAADPLRIPALKRAGIRTVSVEPRRIADIRGAAA